MPTYTYECENCGPFSENRPMAEFEQPQRCPDCGGMAPRMLTLPAIGGGASEEMPCGMPAARAHPGGCACCSAGGGAGRFCAEAV